MEKKKVIIFLLVLMLVALLTLSSSTLAQTSKSNVIKWVGQSSYSTTITPYGPFSQGEAGWFPGIKRWSDWVTMRTNGRLVIEWREPGAIFPATETDNNVSKGVVQIAACYGGSYAGRMPETDVYTGGVFFFEDEAQTYECFHKYGLFRAVQKVWAKRNIYWLPFESGSIVCFGTTFPAPTPESLKGKKMRTVGVLGDLVAMLGGTPVAIPWGDMYMAAKLGTIDGWVAGVMALEETKLKEVAKGLVPSPMISPAVSDFLIHKPAYDALPKDIQNILQNEAPHWIYIPTAHNLNQAKWIIRNAKRDYGLEYYYWSPKDIDRITQLAADTIYPKIAAKSPACAELMEIVKKQMRDYGRIK